MRACAPEHWISRRSGDFQLGQPDQCRCASVAAHLDSRLQTAAAGGALRQAKDGATIICRQMLARHIGRFIERRNGRRNTTRPTARAAVHRVGDTGDAGDAGDMFVAVLPTPSFCVTDNEYTLTLCISLMHLPYASPLRYTSPPLLTNSMAFTSIPLFKASSSETPSVAA